METAGPDRAKGMSFDELKLFDEVGEDLDFEFSEK
jgi:hypothetical protein